MLRVLPATFKPVLKQIRSLQIAKFVAESRVVLLFATKSVHVVRFTGRCKLVLQPVTQLACMT